MMIAQQIEKVEAPSKPLIKPLSNIEIQDHFSLEDPHQLTITQSSDSKTLNNGEMQTEDSSFAEELFDPLCRKRQLSSLFSNSISKRCMMSKLQRMDRVPLKRRHY